MPKVQYRCKALQWAGSECEKQPASQSCLWILSWQAAADHPLNQLIVYAWASICICLCFKGENDVGSS